MPEQAEQQTIYTPTDILNIVKEHLRTTNTPVAIEGVYQMVGSKAYNNGVWWYDEIKSQYDNSKLKAMVPTGIRSQIQTGEVVQLHGTMTKTVNDYDGKIELMLRVSDLVSRRENEIGDEEREQLKLLQQRASHIRKPIDSLIESILFGEERKPRIALIYAESSIADADFCASVQAASGAIDFDEHRQSFADVQGFARTIGILDLEGYDAICVVRGGGSGLDVFDKPAMAAAVLGRSTPIITAIGHEEDHPLITKLSDRDLGNPSLLGTYFKELVEQTSEKKSKSRASLTEKIKKQFQEQLETGQKQNKELQERLTALTKTQEEATKQHKDLVLVAQKQNQELQKKLNDLAEIQKKHTEQVDKMQEANGLLQKNLDKITTQNAESLRQLNEAQTRARNLERQLEEAKNSGGNNTYAIIITIVAVILLAALLAVVSGN